MIYNNFRISGERGKFYLSSKEPQDGYEKRVFEALGKTVYHKFFNSFSGKLHKFEESSYEYGGKTIRDLKVSLIDGDILNSVSVSLKDKKGNYSKDAKMLVSALLNANRGELYTFNSSKSKYVDKNGVERYSVSVYINSHTELNDLGRPKSTGFIHYNDIPRPTLVKDEDGLLDDYYDFKVVNKFWALKIREVLSKFSDESFEAKDNSKLEHKAVTPQEVFVDDDLPF